MREVMTPWTAINRPDVERSGTLLQGTYRFRRVSRLVGMDPTTQLLADRRAVIHGGGGALGGAIARAVARRGAHVFLTGRREVRVAEVAAEVRAAGGRAEYAAVDVLETAAVEAHGDAVARDGGIDIMVNAIGIDHVQGIGLAELTLEDFELPIATYARANFVAAKAAGRHMAARGRGVILTLSTPGARLVGRGWLGSGIAFAAVEAMSRLLAAELGPRGVRVVCVCPDAIPEALARSHTREVFGRVAAAVGATAEGLLAERARTAPMTGRLPTLDEVGETAVFLASDYAAAITGTVVNLTTGARSE
jgi:3-oxoacyl-[acyl-carrier protein] reductase